ncbi:polysaccharide deacetylase family protein [Spongiactinospora sp. TRM90649]|uniref:polysaccharide deacetylase family protein n=1 Tax=Spongiactinospora sp. TRM90649 TaxID=3031114 RepID=UPI0023F92D4E|nr:polysaccharide deacetylase family protein [Spongiactinospora sp. TRM90649]MDF5755033.1 polysaccharide deacetylase family protein [Spongiactinospora sp. TRM90649]
MRTRFAGGIALLTVIAAGCGGLAASPTDPADGPLPSDPTMMDFADPSRVDGLTTRTLASHLTSTNGRRVHITYPSIPSTPALTDRLRDEVTRQLREFTDSTSTESTGGHAPEFNVEWRLAAVSPDVIGVRLRSGTLAGRPWTNATRTLWYHQPSRRALDSTGLLKDSAALAVLAGKVRQRLAPRAPAVNMTSITPVPSMFDSIAFNRDGDLVVEFDDGQVAHPSLGRVAVAVPREEADPLLSAVGRRARQAAVEAPRQMITPPPVQAFDDRPPKARSVTAGSVDCAEAKCVALTFDDGPGPHTDRLLSILAEHGARATFFTLGSNAAAQPGTLRRMRDGGHLVANHSWSHRDLGALSGSLLSDQLARTQSAVDAALGQVPTLMRPPYGSAGTEVAKVAEQMGLSVVEWSVDTRDLADRDPEAIARRAVAGAEPGAVIRLHDVYRETVDALPAVLTGLRERGFVLVTVPELDGLHAMEPGRTYYAGRAATSTAPSPHASGRPQGASSP